LEKTEGWKEKRRLQREKRTGEEKQRL
jgi:hypothetical protein